MTTVVGCHVNRANSSPRKQLFQFGNDKAFLVHGRSHKAGARPAKSFPGGTVSETLDGNEISRSYK
jgi:hypothetical protein